MPVEPNAMEKQVAKESFKSDELGWLFLTALQSYRKGRISLGLSVLSSGHGRRTREALWWLYQLSIAGQQLILEFSGLR